MPNYRFPHMPVPFLPKQEWDAIYEFNSGADECDFSENEWQQTQIPSGLTAEAVYQLLPSAKKFEYGGYLTESQIHFVKCEETSANTIKANPCTFHTHPTNLEGTVPDIPSENDIYSFLRWRHQRAITVGKNLIWAFDKTVETIPVIKQLEKWERANMIETFGQLTKDKVENEVAAYIPIVLKAMGLDWPDRSSDVTDDLLTNWPTKLSKILQFEVTCFQAEMNRF